MPLLRKGNRPQAVGRLANRMQKYRVSQQVRALGLSVGALKTKRLAKRDYSALFFCSARSFLL